MFSNDVVRRQLAPQHGYSAVRQGVKAAKRKIGAGGLPKEEYGRLKVQGRPAAGRQFYFWLSNPTPRFHSDLT